MRLIRRFLPPIAAIVALAFAAEAQAASAPLRYTLRDGTVLLGTQVSEDAATVSVKGSLGTLTLAKPSILSIEPTAGLSAAAVVPVPYPVAVAPPQAVSTRASAGEKVFWTGAILFGTTYFITAIVACTARQTGDRNALLGLAPVAGPVMWTSANDDWAGLGASVPSAFLQGAGVITMVTGLAIWGLSDGTKTVAVAPRADGESTGIVLSGRF